MIMGSNPVKARQVGRTAARREMPSRATAALRLHIGRLTPFSHYAESGRYRQSPRNYYIGMGYRIDAKKGTCEHPYADAGMETIRMPLPIYLKKHGAKDICREKAKPRGTKCTSPLRAFCIFV